MGATPKWYLTALTLPQYDEEWIKRFCNGLSAAGDPYHIIAIGGDSTQGPLTISIQVIGYVNKHHVLRRDGAQVTDEVYVSGTLGDASLALNLIQESPYSDHPKPLIRKLKAPQARIELGQALGSIASACIDVSDGVLQDLNHILTASAVGACIDLTTIPLSELLTSTTSTEKALHHALYGGDDYELCFTVPKKHAQAIPKIQAELNITLSKIGSITSNPGIIDQNHQVIDISGFQHFK